MRFPVTHGAFAGELEGIAWMQPHEARLVVLVHGIGGDAGSRYLVRAAVAFAHAGFHVLRLSMRGAGASVARAPSLYHAGLTADLELVVRTLARDVRVRDVSVVGFSGGGNVALKLAGELGERVPEGLRAVVSISAPLDYSAVGPHMDAPARLPYRFHVMRGLVRQALAFARFFPERAGYDPRRLSRLGSFREYDAEVVVPTYGFRDVDDYWERASSKHVLADVVVPALVLHSADDPMVPGSTVRGSLAHASSAVEIEVSSQGGHIGWFEGLDEESFVRPWAVRRAIAFVESAPAVSRGRA